MGVYSIKDLENFTRIKAHTLRIWEQRYNLLNPQRTDTNIRLYSEKDLKKILNVNLLYNNGFKISKIAGLSEEEIVENANKILLDDTNDSGAMFNHFVKLILEFDKDSIVKELDNMVKEKGFEETFTSFLIPLLSKIGELWQVDTINVAQEHFFSNILRERIIIYTAALKVKVTKGKVILFLPENEYHELGILFYNFYLKQRGYECIYLGQAVPFNDLKSAIESVNPVYIFSSSIAQMDEKEFLELFDKLASCYDLSKFFIGGYQTDVFKSIIPSEVNIVQRKEDIDIL